MQNILGIIIKKKYVNYKYGWFTNWKILFLFLFSLLVRLVFTIEKYFWTYLANEKTKLKIRWCLVKTPSLRAKLTLREVLKSHLQLVLLGRQNQVAHLLSILPLVNCHICFSVSTVYGENHIAVKLLTFFLLCNLVYMTQWLRKKCPKDC